MRKSSFQWKPFLYIVANFVPTLEHLELCRQSETLLGNNEVMVGQVRVASKALDFVTVRVVL